MFHTPFHQSKTSPWKSCYKFCSLPCCSIPLSKTSLQSGHQLNARLLAQSFPPQVFLPRTLSLSPLLFTASTNFSETILFNQSLALAVLAHLFFFRFNFYSSFDTSSIRTIRPPSPPSTAVAALCKIATESEPARERSLTKFGFFSSHSTSSLICCCR